MRTGFSVLVVVLCAVGDVVVAQQVAAPQNDLRAETVAPVEAPHDLPRPPSIGVRPPERANKLRPPDVEPRQPARDASRPETRKNDPKLELTPLVIDRITPGKSTAADLAEAWGVPVRKHRDREQGLEAWHYERDGYAGIAATVAGDRVVEILLYLDPPGSSIEIARKFDLAQFTPTPITDAAGRRLGLVYPERGVVLTFSGKGTRRKGTRREVPVVLVQPILARPFLLRAAARGFQPSTASLTDLRIACRLDPKNAKAKIHYARMLHDIGSTDAALAVVNEAAKIALEDNEAHLLRARLLADQGHFEEAAEITRSMTGPGNASPLERAGVFLQMGNLLAHSPDADYAAAIQHHLEAIDLAEPLATSPETEVRRAAKRLLVDAHLAVAQDVSWGKWSAKEKAVPKWIGRAAKHAQDLIAKEARDPVLRIVVVTGALQAAAGLEGRLPADRAAEEAIVVGRQLLGETGDPIRRRWLESQLGRALAIATQIEHERGRKKSALKYGALAAEHLRRAQRGRADVAQINYLLGRLSFRIGSIHAVGSGNHDQAVVWFDHAVPLLKARPPLAHLHEQGTVGEAFVSMGISYWEQDERNKAIGLSEHGLELMRRAIADGRLSKQALRVAVNNLANMHRELGHEHEAKRYERLAAEKNGKAKR